METDTAENFRLAACTNDTDSDSILCARFHCAGKKRAFCSGLCIVYPICLFLDYIYNRRTTSHTGDTEEREEPATDPSDSRASDGQPTIWGCRFSIRNHASWRFCDQSVICGLKLMVWNLVSICLVQFVGYIL